MWIQAVKQAKVRPWIYGLVAVAAVSLWQWAAVSANYGGNWTALFCTAGEGYVPPELEPGTYRFQGAPGYDGQFYRLIAHDPWLQKGYAKYLDDANLRYRRILQPALTWTLSGGGAGNVDHAYYLTIWLMVLLGTAFSALYLQTRGYPDWLALLFPALPGALVCIDRMTVDLAFYASLAAALAAAARQRWGLCYVAAACAGLSRDLGVLVAGGVVLTALCVREWRRAALFVTAVAPTVLWYAHVRSATMVPGGAPVLPAWTLQKPLVGHWQAFVQKIDYPTGPGLLMNPALLWITHMLDHLVILGVFAAVVVTLARLRKWPPAMETSIALGFVAVYFMVGTPYFWRDLYSTFRAFTPLLALVAVAPSPAKLSIHQAPLALMTLRFLWQLGPQVFGIVRHTGLLG